MVRMIIFTGLALLLCQGCSLPYINTHKDSLTPEEHFHLARAYDEKGEYDAAVREYKKASKQVGEAYYYLGNICFSRHHYQEAEQYYKSAIDRLPEDPRAYNNLAWLYFIQKRKLKTAESLAARGLQLAPSDDSASYRDTLDRIQRWKAGN